MTQNKHTNGLLKTASLQEIIDCFVTTAIALAANSENALTKNNARLITAAPETAAERDRLKEINAELLESLKDCVACLGGKHSEDVPQSALDAISKAKCGA